jgi:hypothetical protein
LQAIKEKLSASVSTISNKDHFTDQEIVDTDFTTAPEPPPTQQLGGWQIGDCVQFGQTLGAWVIEGFEGALAKLSHAECPGYGSIVQPLAALRRAYG